jgi:transposase
VFEGNRADPTTLKSQIDKVKSRFGIKRVVLVGDRGMITAARIRDDLKVSSLDWITCLRAPQIQALAREDGPLQLSLFDERDLAEITSPDFPGERLIVCRNRELAKERARKREALLVATERELARVQVQVRRKGSSLRTAAEIGLAVGEVVNAKKMAKHFALDIRDGHFSWARKVDQIAAEAKLDGIYVVRTSVPAEDLSTAHAVQAYKDLSRVERAFRSMKSKYAQSDTGTPIACARMSSCACSPITSNGTCAKLWRRCCSMTPISMPRAQSALPRSSQPNPHQPPNPRRRLSAMPTASQSTASAASSTISVP